MIVIELNVAVCMLEFHFVKSASPESFKHIFTQITNSSLYVIIKKTFTQKYNI